MRHAQCSSAAASAESAPAPPALDCARDAWGEAAAATGAGRGARHAGAGARCHARERGFGASARARGARRAQLSPRARPPTSLGSSRSHRARGTQKHAWVALRVAPARPRETPHLWQRVLRADVLVAQQEGEQLEPDVRELRARLEQLEHPAREDVAVHVRERGEDARVSVLAQQRRSQVDGALAVGGCGHVQDLLLRGVEHDRVLPRGRLPLARRGLLFQEHGHRGVAHVVQIREPLQGHVGHEVGAEDEHVAAHLALRGKKGLCRVRLVGDGHEVHFERPRVLLCEERLQLVGDRLDSDDDGGLESAALEVSEREGDQRPVCHGEERLCHVLRQREHALAMAASEHHRRDVHRDRRVDEGGCGRVAATTRQVARVRTMAGSRD